MAVVVAAAACLLGPRPAARADKLDKDAERWLREVGLLILPEEEKVFRGLADAADRKEFERIFWARRDPAGIGAEVEAAAARTRARADTLFEISGRKGSETDCGRLLALLGEPAEVEGRELKVHFDSAEALRGSRRPEVWIYRSRAGDALAFTGGELRVSLDEECRFVAGARVREDLRRAAAARVVRPDLTYRIGPDGRLVRTAGATTAAAAPAALDPGRHDFPLTVEPKLLLRTRPGEAYAAGLVRADFGGAAPPSTATVTAQAVDASGQAGAAVSRPVRITAAADGSLVASYGLPLKPGRYTLRVGLAAADKAAVAETPIDVPDFDAPGLKLGTLVLETDAPAAAAADTQDPYAAFNVGTLRLRPRAGNVFASTESLQASCVLYGGEADPATGKPSLRARILIVKDGRPVASGQEEAFDTPMAVVSVGPIPLAGYAPGRYLVRVEARDTVSGKAQTQEAPFEIRP